LNWNEISNFNVDHYLLCVLKYLKKNKYSQTLCVEVEGIQKI
jgi:hypothetical protein